MKDTGTEKERKEKKMGRRITLDHNEGWGVGNGGGVLGLG